MSAFEDTFRAAVKETVGWQWLVPSLHPEERIADDLWPLIDAEVAKAVAEAEARMREHYRPLVEAVRRWDELPDGDDGRDADVAVSAASKAIAPATKYGPLPIRTLPDEPLFVLRGKDKAAVDTLRQYRSAALHHGASQEHWDSITALLTVFEQWAERNPGDMKVPD